MNWLKNLSIKGKLILAMLLTSTTVLLLACAAFVAYEVKTFKSGLDRDMSILADVLSRNSTAALQFDDPAAAETTLLALKAEPHVVLACLYKMSGVRFASYLRDQKMTVFPEHPGPDGSIFKIDHLTIVRPVLMNEKRVGTLYLRVDLEGIQERLNLFIGIVVLVLLSAFILTLILAAALQRVISKPILALSDAAKIIRERKDYSVRVEVSGEDEIGKLTDAFNQMLGEIQVGQDTIQKAHRSLLIQTGHIMEGVGVLSSSAKQILSFSTQVAANAAETATSLTETTTTVGEVRQTVQMTTQKARQVAEGSAKATQISQAGKKAAEEAAEGMRRIRQQMDSIAESMLRLSEQGQAIQLIIATVEDLAAQSNLLAVNASIEAAKAGEQGKGFAVVAQEVRSLAEQSKQATTQVRAILKDIQKATSVAVIATEQGTRVVETGVKQSTQAGESILALARNVSEGAQAVTQIAASSQQQMVGMDQVVTAIQSIKGAAAQNVDSARELETSAQHLNELGQKLRDLVEHYEGQETTT
jgi:methyl-accepting chemotaxis protein